MRGFGLARKFLSLIAVAGCSSPPEPGPAPHPAEARPTRVLLLEGYPRAEYRYLKNALIRDVTFQVDVVLLSADPAFPQEGSPGRVPLVFVPADRKELAQYDVIIIGDVPPRELITPELDSQQVCANLAAWVEGGGGLVLIGGQASMPKLWGETALGPLIPVTLEAPFADADLDYGYVLTSRGSLSPITSVSPDAWVDRDGRGDGLRSLGWLLATRCKPEAHSLVESGPEDRRVPLFVTREAGRGRVFFSATDETWRWRFSSGDEPWFYPFWKRVIAWADGNE